MKMWSLLPIYIWENMTWEWYVWIMVLLLAFVLGPWAGFDMFGYLQLPDQNQHLLWMAVLHGTLFLACLLVLGLLTQPQRPQGPQGPQGQQRPQEPEEPLGLQGPQQRPSEPRKSHLGNKKLLIALMFVIIFWILTHWVLYVRSQNPEADVSFQESKTYQDTKVIYAAVTLVLLGAVVAPITLKLALDRMRSFQRTTTIPSDQQPSHRHHHPRPPEPIPSRNSAECYEMDAEAGRSLMRMKNQHAENPSQGL